jgi:hypothetical protein
LHESAKIVHSKSLKGVESPKNDVEEVVTFHNNEQDVIEKTKP